MNDTEKMSYYDSLGYNGFDYLTECEIEKKRNPRHQPKKTSVKGSE